MTATGQVAASLAALQTLSNGELRERWTEVYRRNPPKHTSRDMLLRGLAYRLQEKALGGLKPATRRRLSKLAGQLEAGADPQAPAPRRMKPGARLLREWRGEMHHVTVVDKGFEYRGRPYRSLSVIAREITGTRWSGPRFFGLTDRSQCPGVNHGG